MTSELTDEQKAARIIAILEQIAEDALPPFSQSAQMTIQLCNAAYTAPKKVLARLYDTIIRLDTEGRPETILERD